VSRARGDTLDARYIECARPTGGSHGLTTDDPVQHGEGAEGRTALQEDGVERGQGHYKGRSP